MSNISLKSKYLIINADDFGWSRGVNEGIIKSHEEGILTSTTLFANAPASRDAIYLAEKTPTLDVGVHLCYGPWAPILPISQLNAIFTKAGHAKFSTFKLWNAVILSKSVREQLYLHFKSQIEHIKMLGLNPTHLDTHKHLHFCPVIMQIVCKLADEFNIPAIRVPIEHPFVPLVGPVNPKARLALCVLLFPALISSLYFAYIKYGLKTPHRLIGIPQTGHWTKQRFLNTLKNIAEYKGIAQIFEIMVHPGKPEGLDAKETRLIESRKTELDILTDNEVKEFISKWDNILIMTNFQQMPQLFQEQT